MTTSLFIIEVMLCCLTNRGYPLSFFFFMDILGTVSMIFEISFLLGPAGKPNVNDTNVEPALVRIARVAKMAARAGRFLKLAKFMELIIFRRRRRQRTKDTASVLSSKLMLSVSTKVSLLTITLVIIIPMFAIGEYPEEDLSMKAWGQQLESTYKRAYNYLDTHPSTSTTGTFAAAVSNMQAFYSSVDYFPYRLRGYNEEVIVRDHQAMIPGASGLEEIEPIRQQNIVELAVSECLIVRDGCDDNQKATLYFNFSKPKRVEAGLEMGMYVFVIFIMGVVTSDISNTINKLVVAPLGRLVAKVRDVAAIVLNLTTPGEEDCVDLDEYDSTTQDETALLEKVFTKLTCIAKITLEENRMVQKDMDSMNAEDQGVLVDMMRISVRQNSGILATVPRRSCTNLSSTIGGGDIYFDVDLDTWDVNFLTMREEFMEPSVVFIVFDSDLMLQMEASPVEISTFRNFYRAIVKGYRNIPYHNAKHAIDVMHTVYRLLSLSLAWHWVGDVNTFALLVAALCHDLGHEGLTNPFLVESRHEWALLYNDASPLENMHCANLFEISKEDGANVFGSLSVAQYKEARRTCIAAILHTDNAHHFEMVKDMQKLYEVKSELCEAQAKLLSTGQFHEGYMEELLQKESLFFLKLFLHMADVSNPTKPFEACMMWADLALMEFFSQGDEEKRLGLPVGMLNDRDKVNRPSSQHGFINFLVSPLILCSVSLFPQFHPLMSELANNLENWRNIWVEDTNPDSEALTKRDEDVRRVRLQAEEMRTRVQARSTMQSVGPTEASKPTS
eukprot:CAMPEP_0115582794 /NCGR_PEP_ID=MMETSP0272-20121206/5845_1 /TAXON_ID=71861 /ORGANISM="Scrippsiella trochoidea, Strain CCMP3099" /LENGTH=785 /DNA_ID=CAMNT_0003017795 /DNA_START=445 /DNA_END=2802 /DNA_ORIENTATION=-